MPGIKTTAQIVEERIARLNAEIERLKKEVADLSKYAEYLAK